MGAADAEGVQRPELAAASTALVDDIVLHGLVGMGSAGPVFGRLTSAER